jgi:hypothetical protein
MTTLYDHPVKPTDSDQDDYELADYDLDVVDDALLNPENSEFLDHFGFKIQVRTDDESSSDDDSDFEAEDNNKTKHNTTAKEPEEEDLVPPTRQSLSATEKSNISSSDDDYSVDTHITTPPAQHKPWPLTVDTTAIENNTSRLSQETTSTSTTSKSNNRASVLSFTGFSNPFKRPQSTATLSSPVIIPRPSQSFHQRQSKRYSETPPIGTPRSPASTQKSFNLLVSKFRRFSHNDHKYDSAKHTALKQEALQELIETKEAMPEINVDWGNIYINIFI